MTKPTVHLIHGFIGAGKTTYAKKLEQDTGAIRFTADEWMTALYGNNPPQDMFAEYEDRAKIKIWEMTEAFVNRGHDVILDFGFWERAARDETKLRIEKMGATPQLHALQISDDIMLERTLKRTEEMPEGALMIDEAGFKKMKAYFESIQEGEDCIWVRAIV